MVNQYSMGFHPATNQNKFKIKSLSPEFGSGAFIFLNGKLSKPAKFLALTFKKKITEPRTVKQHHYGTPYSSTCNAAYKQSP